MNAQPSRNGDPDVLHWDGTALHGTAAARNVAVTVPLRLCATRGERLPPAAPVMLRAAARLKAQRAFAPLGPVACEALIGPPSSGGVTAVLLALPQSVITAVRAAVVARGHVLAALRLAELTVDVPPGGLVQVAGEGCLIVAQAGHVTAVASLGRCDDPAFAATLARERLRLGVAEDAPALPAPGSGLDFLHPSLDAPEPFLERRGVRAGLLAAGLVVLLAAAAGLAVGHALAERAAAQARAAGLRPLATVLAARRAELAEVAPWFEARPSPLPVLAVLAAALPAPAEGQARLIRVRQVAGEEAIAEATASDRAQMMTLLERLRRDPRVAAATIRSSRNPSKESRSVIFELSVRLVPGGDRAAS